MEEIMKRKSITRVTALALAGVMTAGMLTGCGEKPASNQSSQPESKSEAQGSEASKEESSAPAATMDKNDPGITAAGNGIELPEIPDGTLKLEVSIPDYQQSSDGTMIQEAWQKRMEEYLGCKLDISWTRTPAVDYAANEQLQRAPLSMNMVKTVHC